MSYAVEKYRSGSASLSELSKQTGIDVPTIMDAVTENAGEDWNTADAFLDAVKNVAEVHEAPEFYKTALKAIGRSNS